MDREAIPAKTVTGVFVMELSDTNFCCMCGCGSQPQRHVHEIVGSVQIAEAGTDRPA